ncbi:MAG: hypothetical protein ABIB46_03955 [bacterium]
MKKIIKRKDLSFGIDKIFSNEKQTEEYINHQNKFFNSLIIKNKSEYIVYRQFPKK